MANWDKIVVPPGGKVIIRRGEHGGWSASKEVESCQCAPFAYFSDADAILEWLGTCLNDEKKGGAT